MRLLLDTHIWIWSIDAPRRLGRRTRRLLDDSRNELWLSPLSVSEFVLLTRTGRFNRVAEPFRWLDRALEMLPLKDASLSRDIALETGRFRLPHEDPVDRLLVATARVLDLTLVTADLKIIESGAVRTVGND